MAILLIVLTFLCALSYFRHKTSSLSESFVLSTLTLSLIIVITTESLSLVSKFNFETILYTWIGISFTGFIVCKKHLTQFFSSLKNSTINTNKYFYFGVILFFLILFIQGIIYPPNNWDSMTYHMARITHWVMNESAYPYPTHIYRQIYQPPLSEWIIAQSCILTRSDVFANSIQLFFLIGVIGLINLIGIEFYLSKKQRIIASIVTITTPSIILQTTSTQNDIIVGFYILSSFLYTIRFFKKISFKNSFLLGLSISLALLTKGTAFVYFIPLGVLILSITIKNILQKKTPIIKFTKHYLIILVLISAIPFGHFYRNYSLSGDIFGNSEDKYFNEDFSMKSSALGLIKNIGNHLSTPLTYQITNQVVEKAHIVTQIPINDEKISYNGIPFKLKAWNNNEDEVSNFIQILLIIFISFMLIFKWKSIPNTNKYLFIYCLFTFVLFSIILKWQPWHMRLQVPFFMMISIPLALNLDFFSSNKFTNSLLSISTLYVLILILFNPNRPLILRGKQHLLKTRFEKMFIAMPTFLDDYKKLRIDVKKENNKSWDVHGDTWEYPLYYDCFSAKRKPLKSVNIKNPSKKLVLKK